jgi:peptidoglycan/xylan/chitin deacetylase (PgdA/CDA1 family)
MRWGTLLIAVLVATSADARRRGPTPAVNKSVAVVTTTPKVDAKQYTKDPILAGADRIVGRDNAGYVAFTFDDGPNPTYTPIVIDALQKYDIPATFFVVTRAITTAKRAEEAKKLLAKELELGYIVGNHTAHHARLTRADDKLLEAEVDRAFATLSTEAQRPIGLFRAPYGKLNDKTREHLRNIGATEVYWSIDSRDWELEDTDVLRKQLLDAIKAENGGVILMHDTHKVTADVIHAVLDDLEIENCARLRAKQIPIWPVSLHYFLRDGGIPRALPDEVQRRTLAYQKALPDRCAQRAARSGRK